MDNAIFREVLGALKADPGCAPPAPTTAERCLAAYRLSARFPVSRLCERLGIARSTHYYALSPKGRPDLVPEVSDEVERIFREEGQSAGATASSTPSTHASTGAAPRRWCARPCGPGG